MKSTVLGALVLGWLAGAALVSAQNPPTPPPQTPPPASAPAATPAPQSGDGADPADYQIGIGDKLDIQVMGFVDYSLPGVLVQAGGTIQVRDIEQPVLVRDLTAHQIEQKLAKLWLDGQIFSRLPQVVVTVTDYHSQRVFVQGEVRIPGEQTLKGNEMTLTKAIVAAGGYGLAPGAEIEIIRGDQKIPVDRKKLDNGEIRDPRVLANDVIRVPKAPVFYVSGEVKTPGEKTWAPNITVTKAVQMCGGLSPTGSMNGLKIKRFNTDKKEYETIDVKAETIVKPDDEVIVRKKLM